MAETVKEQNLDVAETLSKAEHFINNNRKSLSIIGGAIAIAIIGYLYYQYSYVAGREKEAQQAMFKAEEYFRKDSLRLAINGDGNNPGFVEIIETYGVSPSANLAHYYLGLAYLKNKEYDKAIESLKSYSPKDELTPSLTLAAIGDAYMELNNTDDAISYYKKASKENPNKFSTPIILMKLAGAYELNSNYSDAADIYRQLKKDYATSPEGQSAEKYLARAEGMLGGK